MSSRRTLLSVAVLAAGLVAGTAAPRVLAQEADRARASQAGKPGEGAEKGAARRRADVVPYLEVGQILSAEIKGGNDVVTYTSLAAGVDAAIVTRRTEVAATLRYEHRISEAGGVGDADILSGLVRARLTAARGLDIEGGALATRTRVDAAGADKLLFGGDASNVANLYSFYAGPTLTQRIAGLDVGAAYRFGYSKVDIETPAIVAPGAQRQDAFDSATTHHGFASIGQRPGDLPFGWQLSGGYEREDASQLDQRFEGKYARADVTLPVSSTVALLAGAGYEDIEISQRDPVTDAAGVPLRDAAGRFITDENQPRRLAFDVDGLIWDAGVMWRPSRRTSLTARVGRRYGDTIVTGSLAYRADHATTIQLGVYDGLSSFGRGLSSGLAALPTQFDFARNPVSGDINPCVFGEDGGNCFNPQFAGATGAQFRGRGLQLVLSSRGGAWSYGAAAGYDQRRLLVPVGSPLAALRGVRDETYYLFLSAGRPLGDDATLSLSAYLNHFDNGASGAGDVQSAGLSASYARRFWRGLTGTAAASLNAFDQDGFNSELIGSALVGLRYNF